MSVFVFGLEVVLYARTKHVGSSFGSTLVWELLQKFCITNPFSAKNQQMDLKPKKL